MEIAVVPIEKLNPAEYNPRVDLKPEDPKYQRLKKSILEFDYIDPIIWNKKTGNVVGGHQRLKILKELGKDKIQVSVVDLDPDREKLLNIALNKQGEGMWDFPKLKDLIAEIDTGAFDMEITGFSDDELKSMFDYHIDENGAETNELSEQYQYQIICECENEQDQINLMQQLEEKGVKCRPLIL